MAVDGRPEITLKVSIGEAFTAKLEDIMLYGTPTKTYEGNIRDMAWDYRLRFSPMSLFSIDTFKNATLTPDDRLVVYCRAIFFMPDIELITQPGMGLAVLNYMAERDIYLYRVLRPLTKAERYRAAEFIKYLRDQEVFMVMK